MQKKKFLYIGISIIVLAISVTFVISQFTNNATPVPQLIQKPLSELNFTYTESNAKLKESLAFYDKSLSSPVKLSTKKDIEKYCSFFSDDHLQNQIEYCTSTELRDSDKKFLGNIHIVGSKNMPKIVLLVLQTDPFMQNINEIKSVFDVVIDNLICNCWEDLAPGEIETVSSWIDKQREFHTSNTKPTSQSNLSLIGYQLEMELTTNSEGYLWKLIISK